MQLRSNCPVGLDSPAPLYDPETNYAYLFGGANKQGKTRTIQVYDLLADRWTVIRAELLYPHSHFFAVKYQRKAYLFGGCAANSIETFNLDSGKSTELAPFRDLLDDCGTLMMGFIAVGLRDGLPVIMYLDSRGISRFTEGAPDWAGVSKRMWALDDRIIMMLDSKVEWMPLPLNRRFPRES